jgi:GDP/UDP-N,N'-diacetylbacillosamine 2-epimerase (hydrolysing)
VDEPVRHAISKLSHYHLVATAESSDRLIRMGEREDAICVTGAPGLDGWVDAASSSVDATMATLNLSLSQPFVLAAFHPVVQDSQNAYSQASSLLLALKKVMLPVVWIEPNSDAGSVDILKALSDIGLPVGSTQLKHMTRDLFSTVMKHCAVMVGNSSAGIIEAASFSTPVVNVGSRQHLRERSPNVIDVSTDVNAIYEAVTYALKVGKVPCDNKYGDGAAGSRIADFLTTCPLDPSVLNKSNGY